MSQWMSTDGNTWFSCTVRSDDVPSQLTCSPGPHCCPGPSCPAAGHILPYSASRPPGRLWAAGWGSSDWPVSCGSGMWWTDAVCVEVELVGEVVDVEEWTDDHLETTESRGRTVLVLWTVFVLGKNTQIYSDWFLQLLKPSFYTKFLTQ